MAETSTLLKCRAPKGYRGFESPPLRPGPRPAELLIPGVSDTAEVGDPYRRPHHNAPAPPVSSPRKRSHGLSSLEALRVKWWDLGLTPTARLRRQWYRANRRDRRSPVESYQIARRYR